MTALGNSGHAVGYFLSVPGWFSGGRID